MKPEGYIELGDFAKRLGPRYRIHGKHSGEEFRKDWLVPALAEADVVTIGLDSILGYTASFLEEAFGGLVRELGLAEASRRIRFAAVTRAYLVPLIESWMRNAAKSGQSAAV